MLKIWEFESPVTGIDDFVENGKTIARIIRLGKKELDFKTGQFVMITMDGYEPGENLNKQLWRAYSVCSSPFQKEIELCIAIKEPPSFTHFMNEKIDIGEKIKVKGPYGGFLLREDFDEINFIAAGTGIAPIMSMIRTLSFNGEKRPIRLFYGYRNSNQFYYGGELQSLAGQIKNFSLFTIASREGANPGHVQRLIENFEFENKEAHTYICGPPKMVDDANEIMLQKGFPKPKIFMERYD